MISFILRNQPTEPIMDPRLYEQHMARMRRIADEVASMPIADMMHAAGRQARANPCPNPLAGDTTRDDVELLRAALTLTFALAQADRRASIADRKPVLDNVVELRG